MKIIERNNLLDPVETINWHFRPENHTTNDKNQIELTIDPKTKEYHLGSSVRGGEVFIAGKGWVKPTKWKREFVDMLPENPRADLLKEYGEKYGVDTVLALMGVDTTSYGAPYMQEGLYWQTVRIRYGIQIDYYLDALRSLSMDFYDAMRVKFPEFRVGNFRYNNSDRTWWHGDREYFHYGKFLPYDFVVFYLPVKVGFMFGPQLPSIDYIASEGRKAYENVLRKLYRVVHNWDAFDLTQEDPVKNMEDKSDHDYVSFLSNESIADRLQELLMFDESVDYSLL